MPLDARQKLAHKILESISAVKPLDAAMSKELGTLADSAPTVEVVADEEDEKGGKKKKRRTLQLQPGQNTQ